jgi:hypothetical protein
MKVQDQKEANQNQIYKAPYWREHQKKFKKLIIWRTTKMQAWVQLKYLICFKWVQIVSYEFGPWIKSKVGWSLSKDNDIMDNVSLVRSFKIICSSILSVLLCC